MARFKLTAKVELDNPLFCTECQFECQTESGDTYCSATPDGEFLIVNEYDAEGGYSGKVGSERRPEWCPLKEIEGQYIEVSSTTLKELHRIALGAQMERSGFAGQAFTNYICLRCEKEHTHSDTSVPNFCPDCSKGLLQIFKRDMAQRGAKC
jgi:DNA-directed RNA polymerase subunit RPC12/RpoP